jgi:hypothetical protein
VVETVVGLSGAGGLLGAFVYLLAANRQDRRDYREAIRAAEARADAAEERTRLARSTADEARAARHACEDTCTALRSQIAAMERGSR